MKQSSYKNCIFLAAAFLLTLASSCSADSSSSASDTKAKMVIAASTFMLEGAGRADNIKLHWNPVENAVSYTLERSDGKVLIDNKTKTFNSLFYDDYGVESNSYTYTVKAFDSYKNQIAQASVFAGESSVTDATYTFNNSPTVESGVTSLIKESPLVFDGIYYKYSVERDDGEFVNIVEYSSIDGLSWSEGRVVVTGNAEANADAFYDEDLKSCKLESTCVTSRKGKIIIWSHYEEYGSTYTKACVYCVSGTPGGDFTGHGAYRPLGNASRDLTFFKDHDGRGYLISATLATMYLYRLTEDWTAVDNTFGCVTLQEGEWREAPSLIYHEGWYYLFSSRQNGWLPTEGKYISSKSLKGLAGKKGELVGSVNTFASQSGGVVKIGNQYAMMANRWSGGWEVKDPVLQAHGLWSCQRMLPIVLKEGYAFYDFYSSVKYDCEQGIMIPVQRGRIVSYHGDTSLSSECSGTFKAKYAVDGNGLTSKEKNEFYRGKDYNFDFVVNLGDKYKINGLDISFYTVQGSEAYCTYALYGKENASDDNWALIKDFSDNVMMNFNSQVFNQTQTAYKYIKVAVTGQKRATTNGSNKPHSSVNVSWCTGLYEVSVYGNKQEKI